jgi:predicted HTH transcriptional regulator
MAALKNLQSDIKTTAKYSKTDDRVKNIDKTKGLISRYFVKKDPPMLRHGAGLALDLENSLRRSKVETGRYECKQGFVDLSSQRSEDKNVPNKILETICGIANLGPDADGFIFIGVADKKSDADRIKELDGVDCVTVGSRYVVGVEREFLQLKCDHESYVDKILSFIRNSDLSDTLKHQVLTQVDYVDYKGLSVIRIRIPAQKEVSFLGDVAYTRENSSTCEVNNKKILAINALFA